jgi:23S rRNA pseudouridine1911/1915/1917 synthase
VARLEALIVPPALAGLRLDRVLTALSPDVSRTRWQRAIRMGLVSVNGRVVTEGRRILHAGDHVSATPPPEDVSDTLSYEPPPAPIQVRYEDEFLLVVAKPRGVVVHPSAGHWHQTLVHALWPVVREAGGEPFRPGVVHRLDKDTTGLLLVARRPEVRQALSALLARRAIRREYWALVRGQPDPEQGTIDAPIGRHPADRARMAVVLDGRPATTHYVTMATWPQYAWLGIRLETGRTHQIRVHFAHLGHPVAGDPLYGAAGELGLPGQALHAWHLVFRHPMTNELVDVQEPWPDDWEPALARLGPPVTGSIPPRPEPEAVLS